MTVIGLGGKLRSGKDAIADHLVAEHGFVKIGMSDPLKDHIRILNPWILVRLREAWRLRILPGFHRAAKLLERLGYVDAKTIRDFREFMQRDGTDGGRDFFGENTWADIMVRIISTHAAAGRNVVVTGLRFPNEVEAVQRAGGMTWWVFRPGVEAPSTGAATHASENSVGRNDFGFAIHNDGTLEDLAYSVDALLYALTGREVAA